MFRLAPGVLRGYAQGESSSGWFRGLGCSLGRAGPAVWRVLIAASCVEASKFAELAADGFRLAGVILQRSICLTRRDC